MALDLPFIWAGIIALAVLLYVLLDGFDLGVGIVYPSARSEEERAVMMNSIAPVWDGNETWLVMGGGGLLAVFPLAYAIVMPALYMPITIMLLALVFRGVSFEFRWRTQRWRGFWDQTFFYGSLVAAFCQGIALGALVQGIAVEGRAYAGGWFDWLSPFSLLTGISVVCGYALLGATWLNMKTGAQVAQRMRDYAFWLGLATLACIGLVSVFTPFLNPVYFERWFSFPESAYTYAVPLIVLGLSYALYTGLRNGSDRQPFFAAQGLFVACFVGIGISFYPMMVPPSLSIYQAAAPDVSLGFLLIGALPLLVLVLAYTGYAYWVFRGKVDPSAGYH